MTRPPSPEQAVSLAANYALTADVGSIALLKRDSPDALPTELVLRIVLTYLPETTEPGRYLDFVLALTTDERFSDFAGSAAGPRPKAGKDADLVAADVDISDLVALEHPLYTSEPLDPVSHFVLHRAHQLEEYGLISFLSPLVEPFLDQSSYIRTWFVHAVLPLVRGSLGRLDRCRRFSLEAVLGWSPEEAVDQLVDFGEIDSSLLLQNIRCLFSPWAYGHSLRTDSQDGWAALFNSLQGFLDKRLLTVLEIVLNWNGPQDLDHGGYSSDTSTLDKAQELYYSSIISYVYALSDLNSRSTEICHSLLNRVESMLFLPRTSIDLDHSAPHVDGLGPLLKEPFRMPVLPSSPYSAARPESLSYLAACVVSVNSLDKFKLDMTIPEVSQLRSRALLSEQRSLLGTISDSDVYREFEGVEQWKRFYMHMSWLWGWTQSAPSNKILSSQTGSGIFGSIKRGDFEKELIQIACRNGAFDFLKILFLAEAADERVEFVSSVTRATLQPFFNSTTDAQLKSAFVNIDSLLSRFDDQSNFACFGAISKLRNASTKLLRYDLRNEDGTLSQILRDQPDPIQIVEKVLTQNKQSYRDADSLGHICAELIMAGVGCTVPYYSTYRPLTKEEVESQNQRIKSCRAKVFALAAMSALQEDDFETAYAWLTAKLDGVFLGQESDEDVIELACKAAVAVGTYRSSDTVETILRERRLEQRLDVLSRALLISVPNLMGEILTRWRQCEEERNGYQNQRLLEDRAYLEEHLHSLLGKSYNTVYLNDEDQQEASENYGHLSELAQGAVLSLSQGAALASAEKSEPNIGGRSRKRDAVVKAVSAGLGWMLRSDRG